MITALDHIHVYASDPPATIDFYVAGFGAEHLGRIRDTRNELVILGGQFLVVSPYPDGMTPGVPPEAGDGALRGGYGVAHFGLQTRDLDGVVARLAARGVRPHDAPRQSGAIRFVYLTGPDGVVIELVELKLSGALAVARAALDAVNAGVHRVRRAAGRRLVE